MQNLPKTQSENESSMDSPAIVELLFSKFRAMYGVKLADQWAGCNLDEVKAAWDEALADLELDEVRDGLHALVVAGKPFPPTLPEFYAMCRPPMVVPLVSDHQGLDELGARIGVYPWASESYHAFRQRIVEALADHRQSLRLVSKSLLAQ